MIIRHFRLLHILGHRTILPVVLAVPLMGTGNSVALAKTCDLGFTPPTVSFKIYQGDVRINNGHSARQLAAKFGNHDKLNRRAGWVTRGLTKTDLESRIEVAVQYRPVAGNQYCVGLKTVAARVGYKHFKVYVARHLRAGSCEYRTTWQHEQSHVAIYRDQLQQFAPKFENQLNRVAVNLKPVVARSAKSGHAYFIGKLNSQFKQVFAQLNKATKIRQGHLDTPQNYRREQAMCPAPSRSIR